jgi:hypothetical protein
MVLRGSFGYTSVLPIVKEIRDCLNVTVILVGKTLKER